MKLTLIDLKKFFIEILQEKKSFEEASDWASNIIQMDEQGKLEIESKENISKIFEALTYLTGLDIKDSSGAYFHSINNVKDEFDNLFDLE